MVSSTGSLLLPLAASAKEMFFLLRSGLDGAGVAGGYSWGVLVASDTIGDRASLVSRLTGVRSCIMVSAITVLLRLAAGASMLTGVEFCSMVSVVTVLLCAADGISGGTFSPVLWSPVGDSLPDELIIQAVLRLSKSDDVDVTSRGWYMGLLGSMTGVWSVAPSLARVLA